MIIIFIFVFFKMQEVERPNFNSDSTFLEDFREVFVRGIATKRWILFSTFGMFITSLTSPFRAPFAHEIKGADQFLIGGMATSSLIVQVLFAAPLARLADRIGRKKVFYGLIPLYWASNLLLVYAPSNNFLLVSGFLLGFQNISSIAILASIRAELVPLDCLGRWRGILSLFGGLAAITASLSGGFIWENFGPSYIFLLPIFIDLIVRIPIISSIPETLKIDVD